MYVSNVGVTATTSFRKFGPALYSFGSNNSSVAITRDSTDTPPRLSHRTHQRVWSSNSSPPFWSSTWLPFIFGTHHDMMWCPSFKNDDGAFLDHGLFRRRRFSIWKRMPHERQSEHLVEVVLFSFPSHGLPMYSNNCRDSQAFGCGEPTRTTYGSTLFLSWAARCATPSEVR
jgi:hypothetical protein